MRQARRRLTFLDDAELNYYLRLLGQRLVASSDSPQQEFHFYIVKDSSINAFAVPGGFIMRAYRTLCSPPRARPVLPR